MVLTQRVEAALVELQRYLHDEIPPNSAADAVATLMAQPPDVVMERVAAWAVEQSRAKSRPVSDLLLHALKKFYVTGELKLLDRSAVADYLDRVMTIALRICPPEERDHLRNDMTKMRMSGDTDSRFEVPVTRIPTLSGFTPVSDAAAQTDKRFELIFDRLSHEMASGGPQAAAPEPQALAQLLTMAATRSQTGQQFNDYMNMIRPLTGGKEGNVFVILGGGMPSWDMSSIAPGVFKPPAQVAAMEKIIDLSEDPVVAMKRFRELVVAAIEKFNDASLGASVWMLDVAEDAIKEKKLDVTAVDQIRAEVAETISSVQLRKYAENKTRHAAVKLVLEFFPTLQLPSVMRQLRGEPRAERRRTLLGIAEAYGILGRNAAFADLDYELHRSDVDTYYLRNLIFLLHRISRESDDGVERELAAFVHASAPGQNIYVIKEAANAMGQIRTEASAKVLTTRLAEFESTLLRNDTSAYPVVEMQRLLDRIIASLARIGTPGALLTIARHGMKANPPLGDTRARLAALSQHDLSFDEQTVNVLLKALRDDIPGKLFGRLPKIQESTVRLIEALSGTRSEEVEDLFKDIAQRFADQDVGRAAAQVLEKWFPTKPPSREPLATLTGELEFFGLPAVMQSLGEMQATGMLTLRTKEGQAAAKLVFTEGKFLNAQRGIVRGAEAIYDILERPVSGTFAFVPYTADKMQTNLAPRDIMEVLLEGMRRHDELQSILAIVPDDLTLTTTSTKPIPHEKEDDPIFIRDVWLKASGGTKVGEWEREIPSDSYRVRRLVAHWLEQGALVGQ